LVLTEVLGHDLWHAQLHSLPDDIRHITRNLPCGFRLPDALRQLLARTRNLVRAKLAETFDYGTHKFTDAIDSDGHGNGPFHLRLALTREKGKDGEDKFIFDATATDDQSPGPVNLLLNPDVPGTALSMFYLGGDPAQVCNAGGPQALDEVRLREGSLLWPRWPAPPMPG